MIRCLVTLFIFIITLPGNVSATLTFCGPKEASELMVQHDIFFDKVNPLTRSLTLKVNRDVSFDEYANFLQKQTLPWSEEEKIILSKSYEDIIQKINEQNFKGMQIPPKITMVKVTGIDQFFSAYTRGTTIFFPDYYFYNFNDALSARNFYKLLTHELIHIISRNSPVLQKQQYKELGFKLLPESKIKQVENVIKETVFINPDAPRPNAFATVEYQGEMVNVVPFLDSEKDLNYIWRKVRPNVKIKLFVLDKNLNPKKIVAAEETNYKQKFKSDSFSGYNDEFELSHPEEMFAVIAANKIDFNDSLFSLEEINNFEQDYALEGQELQIQGRARNKETLTRIASIIQKYNSSPLGKRLGFPSQLNIGLYSPNGPIGGGSYLSEQEIAYSNIGGGDYPPELILHEYGHIILDHYLGSRENWNSEDHSLRDDNHLYLEATKRAIHELFADFLVAFYFSNPRIVTNASMKSERGRFDIESFMIPPQYRDFSLKMNDYLDPNYRWLNPTIALAPLRYHLLDLIEQGPNEKNIAKVIALIEAFYTEYTERVSRTDLWSLSWKKIGERILARWE